MVAAVVPAHAQSNAPRASSTSQSPAQPPGRPDPEIKRSVIEDDKVRIEELKVRGQVQRIVVSPKASGVRPYEIVPPDAGRDASQQSKGLSGQRLWQVFSF
jgi:hypothetical protein